LEDSEIISADLEISLNGVTHRLNWLGNQTLVDALLEEGIDVPYSCRAGKCAACVCTMVEGTVVMENNAMLDDDDIAEGYILGCQAKPRAQYIKISF